MGIIERTKNAWNVFRGREPTIPVTESGYSSSRRNQGRKRLSRRTEMSIVSSVYNRMALDASAIEMKHVYADENNSFVSLVPDSSLNSCLTLEANIDQTARDFRHDLFLSMFDEGEVAVVPVDTDIDPTKTESYKIVTMRRGKILEYYPHHVKVEVYNDRKGILQTVTLSKSEVAIIRNPFYTVMNEPNSTLQRLIRKLNLLDFIDEQSGAGKLDLVIQLPYAVKNESRKARAEERRKDIEAQLANSKYGIAWIDQTEHITQINRSVTNNLLTQIESLTSMLYSQLSIDVSVLNGTADDKVMLNYENRVIEVLVSAVTEEYRRKFLTQNARTRGQTIMAFRDPFKLLPVNELAEIADKVTRNEIMTANEIRQKMGLVPSKDPGADELRNKNISQPADQQEEMPEEYDPEMEGGYEEEYEE